MCTECSNNEMKKRRNCDSISRENIIPVFILISCYYYAQQTIKPNGSKVYVVVVGRSSLPLFTKQPIKMQRSKSIPYPERAMSVTLCCEHFSRITSYLVVGLQFLGTKQLIIAGIELYFFHLGLTFLKIYIVFPHKWQVNLSRELEKKQCALVLARKKVCQALICQSELFLWLSQQKIKMKKKSEVKLVMTSAWIRTLTT